MDVDPTLNTVTFEVEQDGEGYSLTEQVPAQAEDGFQKAWQSAQGKMKTPPENVREIFSLWEASTTDKAFLAALFPQAEVGHALARPNTGDWETAFAEAARALQAAVAEEEQARQSSGADRLFPVLRTYDAGDLLTQTTVHRVIGADLAVSLARIGPTPHGTIGIEYVMKNSVGEGEAVRRDLFEAAYDNLREGLRVNVSERNAEKIFSFSHPSDMAASAVCLPDFAEQVFSWLEQGEVFVAVLDPNSVFAVLPGGEAAGELRKMVEKSPYWGAVALTPACYLLNRSGWRQIAARSAETL